MPLYLTLFTTLISDSLRFGLGEVTISVSYFFKTISSSVGTQEEILKKLQSDAMRSKWSEVLETYKQEKALRTTKITVTGDTVLHMAVIDSKEKVVADMVDFLVFEQNNLTQNKVVVIVDGDDKGSQNMNIVLGAENDKKNTPLHVATKMGNVEMCKKIGGIDPSLIIRRNIVGETPLFLAALYGWKDVFLWLHYQYMGSPGVSSTDFTHCLRDDDDTILHCAIAEGHYDVAIEIIHLYKDLVRGMRRNKEGLSPLHLLAVQHRAFKSTALLELSILSRPIYRLLKVEEKNQATTFEELQKENQRNTSVKFIKFIHWLLRFLLVFTLLRLFEAGEQAILLALLTLITLLSLSKPVLTRWLHKMQRMKEAHACTLQIMNQLLENVSDKDMSQIISRRASEQLSIFLQGEEFNESESTTAPPFGRITIETPLMIAAKNGVTEMVEKILELFPSRFKDVNDEGKNIVLLAIEYRQTEVFRFLHKQKWLCESLFGHVDKEGNNALHLTARLGVELDGLNPGEALSILREDNWFKFVMNSMPPGLLKKYNRKMETPRDIFVESHKEPMKSKGEWVAKTSKACSMMSTIVFSLAFATCTNVPRGYDDKGGYPILRNKLVFQIFDASSFYAFTLSLISTICFLSIVASPSQSFHYLRYVPYKLYFGLFFMCSSIICLGISFYDGGFYKPDDDPKNLHIALLCYILIGLVIILYVVIQFSSLIGPMLFSMWGIPTRRRRKATHPIEYRRTKNEENGTDLNHQN